MKPYYHDLHTTLYKKSCLDMSELPDESVQMVVTSPPYLGLRKYSGEQDLIWGGEKDCEHNWNEYQRPPGGGHSGGKATVGATKADIQRIHEYKAGFCSLCGAWRGAYGLEPTPEMYVQHTIEILREIRRVLRKDGVVFWNIGDSYAGSWGNSGSRDGGQREVNTEKMPRKAWDENTERPASSRKHPVIKPKDLCLIPFRVAIAAQEDGWWVRSDIIWAKPNPMPESVTDRPTNSHEYILMLTKSARYYWDADAVREPQNGNAHSRGERLGDEVYQDARDSYKGFDSKESVLPAGRNLRSVWTFPTQPYPEAHFAVFPEKLPELCIKAATPEGGCCSKCGKPWVRITETEGETPRDRLKNQGMAEYGNAQNGNPQGLDHLGGHKITRETKTLGWQPQCKCEADKVPSVVLDPFAGAGTTLCVAKKLNRRAVGYELSEEYCKLAVDRNRQQVFVTKFAQ